MTTLNDLRHHCTEYGDCFLWKRCTCNGHPAMRKDGKTKLVRRILWESKNGPIPNGGIIKTTCGDVLCINPEHFELTSMKKLCKELGALGVMSGAMRSAAIQKTKRKTHGKLTLDAVNHIRSSNETTVKLAEIYGVAQGHISKVRKNKVWVNYSSPFSGLFR